MSLTTTSLTRKHNAHDAVLQIAEEDRYTDKERESLLEILNEHPNAQRTIVRLSAQAVAMREKVRDIDREIKSLNEQLHATDLFKELALKKRLRKSCIEYQQECEAQERGVWASLLSGIKKKTRLYRKMLSAAGIIGEGE